jgi:adenylate kinase
MGTLRALLVAPPGAGKGTQGERLAQIYDVPHISTGDLLREEVEQQSAIGSEAQSIMDQGDLVPDLLVMELVLKHLAADPKTGFVLDGFPRTLGQADLAYEWGMGNGRTFHAVINLVVPEDELVKRLLLRGAESDRSDDKSETIRKRLRVYSQITEQLLDFYRGQHSLIEVDGTGAVEEVTERIRGELDLIDLTD